MQVIASKQGQAMLLVEISAVDKYAIKCFRVLSPSNDLSGANKTAFLDFVSKFH